MAESFIGRLLQSKLDEARRDRESSIGTGACADYAAYREQVGFVAGLAAAHRLIDEIEEEHDGHS